VHYLPLPVAFRSRGGFGTHWMFAREIQISNPLLPVAAKEHTFSSGKSDDQVKLQRAEVLVLWRALYDPGRTVCEQASQAKEGTLPKGWTSNVATVASGSFRLPSLPGASSTAPSRPTRVGSYV